MRPFVLTSMYFPNRELLSFLVVLALPNASMIGLLARICLSVSLKFSPSDVLPVSVRRRDEDAGREGSSTDAKYRRMNLADTVLPAPLRTISLGSDADKQVSRCD